MVWKMTLLCAWQGFVQAYSCTEGRPTVHPPFKCASTQLWESITQIASRMLSASLRALLVLCCKPTSVCWLASKHATWSPPLHVLHATCSPRVWLEGFTLPMNLCQKGQSLSSFGVVHLLPAPCFRFSGCVADGRRLPGFR